jgi:hypothetical protein
MKSNLDRLNLRPFERRLVVGVGTVVFIVLNLVFVWPHFSDRGKALNDLDDARTQLAEFEKKIGEAPDFQRKVRALESEAEPVPPEDQGLQFLRTIQTQAAQSGVQITGNSKETIRTNSQFFVERSQTVTMVAAEQQLVDFLFNIGAAGSMIRARDLTLRPDAPRQRLGGSVKLVASYQKKAPPKSAPAAAPTGKPVAKAAEKAAAKPAEKPALKPADKPLIKPVEKTAGVPSPKPGDTTALPPRSGKLAPLKPAPPDQRTPMPGRDTDRPANAGPGIPPPPPMPLPSKQGSATDKPTNQQE